MDATISFDEIAELKSGNATLWHYGTATVNGKDFYFTLAEMKDNNWSSFEITWVDETPENHEELDQIVIDAYQEESSKLEES